MKIKKIISLVMAMTLALTFAISFSTTFASDTPTDWAASEVSQAVSKGLVPEHINSKYQNDITRADFCDLIVAMITKALNKTVEELSAGAENSFPDTSSKNVICAAYVGIVNGRTNGNFDPEANITRQEAAKMLALAAKATGADIATKKAEFADGASVYEWAWDYISYVNGIGVMKGTSTGNPPNFSPIRTYSREQSILTVLRLFNFLTDEPVEYEPRLSKIENELGLSFYVPTKTEETPGLIVKGTKAYHNGEEFAQIGINFFGGFLRAYTNKSSSEYDRIFDLFNEYGIKYCRVNMGMFWPTNYDLWEKDKAGYIEAMDKFVKAAEEHNIGIIGSMFWNMSGINYHFEEHLSAWYDTSSKTYEYMMDYTELLVLRYNNSPAIWGWEFGNETNLSFDIPGAEGNVTWESTGSLEKDSLGQLKEKTLDDLSYANDIVPTMQAWAALVDELEPFGRIITTGNGEPRPSQWHQFTYGGSWESDSYDEYVEISNILNPVPFNAVSAHTYDLYDRFFDHKPTYDETVKTMQKAANDNGQIYFIGEFHGLQKDLSKQVIDAIVNNKVPVSCIWAIGDVEYSLDLEPEIRDELLAYIKTANDKMLAK